MKRIITTGITTAVGMPIKSGTIEHLQAAYQEALTALARTNILSYDASKIYVLYGCENSGSGANYVISAGAVFYNGEVYLVPAATFSTSGGSVAIGTITTTYFTATNADPVEFTDAILRSVHEIKTIVISSGTSGSGTADLSNFIYTNGGRIFGSDTGIINLISGNATITSFYYSYFKLNGVVTFTYQLLINVTSNTTTWGFEVTLPYVADLVNGSNDNYNNAGGMINNTAYVTTRNWIKNASPNILNIDASVSTTSGSRTFYGQITYKAI
jgi:hypothetical protein